MKKAFTLAEVLITLGIIGIVASMTLPAIVQKNQKTVAITRLKKFYSQSMQAFVAAQREDDPNGAVLKNMLLSATSSVGDPDTEKYFADTYIKPYFKVVKDYGVTKLSTEKFPRYYPLNGVLDPDANSGYSSANKYILTLADGSIVYIGIGAIGDPASYGITLAIDVNGLQKPNVLGKDTFYMAYYPTKNILKMMVLDLVKTRQDYLDRCNRNSGTIASRMCGALIQHDGWEMKEDYPW